MALAQDAIDKAIASAVPPPAQPAMAQFGLELPTGRPAALMVPKDMSDLEWLGLVNGLLQIADQMRAQRPPPSGLVVARGVVGR